MRLRGVSEISLRTKKNPDSCLPGLSKFLGLSGSEVTLSADQQAQRILVLQLVGSPRPVLP